MKRKIINIDTELCTGCGLCIPECPEGTLQIIDGKARLVSDLFCDGLGACIGHCPEGAIKIEEREAEPYSEMKVMANVVEHGANTIKAHLQHLRDHNEHTFLQEAMDYLKDNGYDIPEGFDLQQKPQPESISLGCPGSISQEIERKEIQGADVFESDSELTQWPVQLKLINPRAPYFDNCELLIAADCVPFAHGDFHRKYLRGKKVIMFCPKLDSATEEYIEKLAMIFADNIIRSITVLHMEVPCCFGTKSIVHSAQEKAGSEISVEEINISIQGIEL